MRLPPRSGWAPSAAAFVLLTVVSAVWGLSVPLFSGPDEPSHVVKAAAVANGQLGARDIDDVPHVRVAAVFLRADVHECYQHRPETSAACAPDFVGGTERTDVPTLAGRYPPLYYALVGLPLRLSPDAGGVYAARALSAALSAALLAAALSSAVALGRRGWPVLGLAAGITPLALYLSGMVNPNGFEVAAAACLWTSGAAVLLAPPGPVPHALVARTAVAGALLCLSRGLSPLWAALVVLVLLLLVPLARLAGPELRRPLLLCTGVIATSGVLASLAAARAGLVPGTGADVGLLDRVRLSAGRTPRYVRQTIGEFGWLDAPTPDLALALWLTVVCALVVLGLAAGTRRQTVALLLLLGLVVVVPVALEAAQSNAIGPFWQGRYQLPLALGVPLLAALACSRAPVESRRVSVVVLPALAVAHLASWAWVVRRYAVGLDGPLDARSSTAWSPPLPLELLLPVQVVAVSLLAVLLHRCGPAAHDAEVQTGGQRGTFRGQAGAGPGDRAA
jgi:hypothetical protein